MAVRAAGPQRPCHQQVARGRRPGLPCTWPEEITRLKEKPGRNINISGSATLVAWLLGQGLLDELNLLLFPVVAGHGKRLFADEGRTTALTLARSEAFSTGVVQLIYHPVANA